MKTIKERTQLVIPVISVSALRELGHAISHIKDFNRFVALLEASVSDMLDVKQAAISLTEGSASEIKEKSGFLDSRFLIPLAVREKLLGVLSVRGKKNDTAFGPNDLRLMAALSDFVSALVDHAGRYREDVRLFNNRRLLLDSISCGIVSVNNKGKIVTLNPAGGSILGLEPSIMIGQDMNLLPIEIADGLRRVVEAKEVSERAEFYLERSGKFIGGTIAPVVNEDRDRAGAAIIFEDLKGIEGNNVLRSCLDKEITRSRRYGRTMTVAIFTAVKDLGTLLKLMHRLRERLRKCDVCGRYDKNRLAVVLPETEKTGAVALLCRIRSMIEGGDCKVGLATWPNDGETVAELTKTAEESMLDISIVARRTVLTHDDSNVVNDMIELIFDDDYIVLKSTNAEKTLNYLEKEKIDCFISEYDLSGEFDGPYLVGKARERNPMIKPFLTAFHMTPEKKKRSEASGARELIAKPFDVRQLRQLIHHALD